MKKVKKTVFLNHLKFAEEFARLGLTQEKFAEKVFISDRYVRTLLKTDKRISLSLAYNLSYQFGVSVDDLLIIIEDEDY